MHHLRQSGGLQTFCRWALIRCRSHVATETACGGAEELEPTAGPVGTPSGWSPPSGRPAPPGVKPTIPFRIVRSRYGNLPVYLDYKSGGSRVLTIIRKVEGDVEALEKMVRAHLDMKKGLLTRADSLTGSVTISGSHRDRTVAWLRSIGF